MITEGSSACIPGGAGEIILINDIPISLSIDQQGQIMRGSELTTMELHQPMSMQFTQQNYCLEYTNTHNNMNNPQVMVESAYWTPLKIAAKKGIATNIKITGSDDYEIISKEICHDNITEEFASSDTSAIEDGKTDADAVPTDEPFAYLQGLNSDNLMQFSQQSALQELMLKEQMDIKPNLDTLPTFEEHDIGGYKFQLNLRPETRGKKVTWMYSEPLHKIYIRMNEIFSVDAVYTPKMPLQQLRIRALLCFVKEVSEPVLRCQNHISKDTASHPKLRQNLLRCENPSTEYCGTTEGKNMNDRFSVLLPLCMSGTPKDDNSIKQTIAFKFTCQNSCIGRRETRMIFLLEGMNGEVLSQRVLDVKICSCPKRDKSIDERNIQAPKRKRGEDLCPRAAKLRKQSTETSLIKSECSSSDLENNYDVENVQKNFDIQRTSSGGFRVVMELYSKEAALETIKGAHNIVAGSMVNEPQQTSYYSRYIRRLKSLYDRGLKM